MDQFDQSALDERWAKRQLMRDWLRAFDRPYSYVVTTHHSPSSASSSKTLGDSRFFRHPNTGKRHQLIGVSTYDVNMEPRRKVRRHLTSVNTMPSLQLQDRRSAVVSNTVSRLVHSPHHPATTASALYPHKTYRHAEPNHCRMNSRPIETARPSILAYESPDQDKSYVDASAPVVCSVSPVWRPKRRANDLKWDVSKTCFPKKGLTEVQRRQGPPSEYSTFPTHHGDCADVRVDAQSSSAHERLVKRTALVIAESLRSKAAAAPSTASSHKPTNARPKKTSRYLREMDRREILARISQGEKQSVMAAEYNVSRAAICNLVKHRDEVLGRMHENPNAKHPKKPRKSMLPSPQDVIQNPSGPRESVEARGGYMQSKEMANRFGDVRPSYSSSWILRDANTSHRYNSVDI